MLYQKHLAKPLLWVALILSGANCPLFGENLKVLPGHVPKIVSSLKSEGRLAPTRKLRLAIGLPMHDTAGLDAFLAQVYNPASPNFHQYLTPTEVAARYGPTVEDYEAVKAFARSNGLAIATTYDNRLVLDVTGPATAVEKAFHITLRTYKHPTEARDFFAPDTEPTVDGTLPVVDVQGLSNYARPHPRWQRMDAVKTNARSKAGSSPDGAGEFFGNDFRNAYAPDTTLTGAGQTLGLFEADGYYTNDIAAYAAAAGNGRTNILLQTVLLDGFSGTPTTAGNPEVSLDIELAMAMAPGLTKIVVYEGSPTDFIPNDILNSMLSGNATVKNLSSSWGWSGGPSTSTDNIFKSMAAAGQSYFNAAGDSDAFTTGASSANGVDNPSLENAPSSSPYITQVGGTTLTMTGSGDTYASETVWNWGVEYGASDDGKGGSGGISSYYSIPAWQTNINLTAVGGSPSFRNIPDVALTADNIYVNFGNGSAGDYGGTSCAAPLWAGFIALANQQAVASDRPVVGFVNPALYSIAAGADYTNCFHDVTTGNDTSSTSPDFFYATNGYDLCSGLGTPAGQKLINALVGVTDALVISPPTGAASGVAGGPFTVTSGNFLLANTTNSPLVWSLINLPTWLNISPASGTLAGGAQANLTVSFTAAADSLVTGTHLASLTFSNVTSHVVQTGSFTLVLSQPLLVSPTTGFAVSGVAGGPFSPTSQNFVLTNQSSSSLAWGVSNAPAWLNVSPAGGTLSGNATTTFTATLTTAANSLTYGTYTANLLVTNFAGLAASLPVSITAINPNTPIVANGGFETGNLTGWTLLHASSKNNGVTASPAFVHSGTYGMLLGQSGSLGYMYQTLTTVPGQSYLLSLWLTNPTNSTGATPNQFVVGWNGTAIYDQSNLPFTAWTNLQFIVTATGTSTVLEFGFDDSPYYLALDDVSVTPYLPPTFNLAQPATAAGFNLNWTTIAGLTYQVQYTTNLDQPNWINLGGSQTANTTTLNLVDTNAVPSSPGRFYRIVQLAP